MSDPKTPHAPAEDSAATALSVEGNTPVTSIVPTQTTPAILAKLPLGAKVESNHPKGLRLTYANEIAQREGDGPGIPKEAQDRVFELFDQLAPSERETPHGGVGLSIVKKIVEQHKGICRLESKMGRGTSFYFERPQEPNHTPNKKKEHLPTPTQPLSSS